MCNVDFADMLFSLILLATFPELYQKNICFKRSKAAMKGKA